MAKNYNGMAVGVFELDNLVACFVALDAAAKAANVTIQSVERNRLKSGACVKMRGSVSDVNAAMEVALEAAKPLGQVVSNAILVIDQMLKTSEVAFRTWNTKCGGHTTVFLSGDVAAVTAAVDSVKGNPPCEIIAAAVISNPSEEAVRLVEEEAAKHASAK